MNRALVVMGIALLILAVGGSFWAGMKVGENRLIRDPARFLQQLRGGQGGQIQRFTFGTPPPGRIGTPGLGGGMMGTIEAIEGTTVLLNTGQETIRVQTTDTTLIEKYMPVKVSDLQIGERVTFSGSRNADGSYTARSIQSLRAFPSATPSR